MSLLDTQYLDHGGNTCLKNTLLNSAQSTHTENSTVCLLITLHNTEQLLACDLKQVLFILLLWQT